MCTHYNLHAFRKTLSVFMWKVIKYSSWINRVGWDIHVVAGSIPLPSARATLRRITASASTSLSTDILPRVTGTCIWWIRHDHTTKASFRASSHSHVNICNEKIDGASLSNSLWAILNCTYFILLNSIQCIYFIDDLQAILYCIVTG